MHAAERNTMKASSPHTECPSSIIVFATTRVFVFFPSIDVELAEVESLSVCPTPLEKSVGHPFESAQHASCQHHRERCETRDHRLSEQPSMRFA